MMATTVIITIMNDKNNERRNNNNDANRKHASVAITLSESCQGLATAGPYCAWLHSLPESAATDCVQNLKEAGPGGRKIRHFSIKD